MLWRGCGAPSHAPSHAGPRAGSGAEAVPEFAYYEQDGEVDDEAKRARVRCVAV